MTADTDFRTAPKPVLAAMLRASRRDTLATFAAYEAALPTLQVPYRTELNPPLWELGHIDWFQHFWLHRNPQCSLGVVADAAATRLPPWGLDSDALFNSSLVPHDTRWQLPLPGAAALRAGLASGLERTLELLQHCAETDQGLYFHRLVLAHEDMHHEAALYMAQALALPLATTRWQLQAPAAARQTLALDAQCFEQGCTGAGFAFDNEIGAHAVDLPACQIDSRVVLWREYLPFVEAGGYAQARWWTEAGRAWCAASDAQAPRYVCRDGSGWQRQVGNTWQTLDPALPACHVNAHEADAWCAWAGRRLPSEAEWERAAVHDNAAFEWGQVWEWTASAFAPYPGFVAHPYQDYSAPWFGSRRVLRGASFATQPRLRHVRYRNYFTPDRNDIFAGFRSCAL